jgi:hypothetical protein
MKNKKWEKIKGIGEIADLMKKSMENWRIREGNFER